MTIVAPLVALALWGSELKAQTLLAAGFAPRLPTRR